MSQQIINIPANVETLLESSPFLPQNPTHYSSTAGANVYAVNLPGRDARSGLYQRWDGDGSTTVWDANEIVNLANAPAVLTGIADQLEIVVLVNGVVLKRVDETATPGAGEFKVADNGGTNEITFGDTLAVGAKIEMFLTAAGTVPTFAVAASNSPEQHPAYQVVLVDAAVKVVRLTR